MTRDDASVPRPLQRARLICAHLADCSVDACSDRRRSANGSVRAAVEVLIMMIRSSVLTVAAMSAAWLICGCSSRPAPAPPSPASAPKAEVAEPASVRFAMAGEVSGMPSLAISANRVALVWAGTKNNAMNVYSAVSEDGGVTFPVQERVTDRDGDVSASVEQPPRVAVSSTDITVIWSSRKTGNAAIRLSRSADGGRTFSPAITIHDSSLKGARGWESLTLGQDGLLRAVWLDGRNADRATDEEAHTRHMAEVAANHGAMDRASMAHGGSPRQDVYAAVIDPGNKIRETPIAANVCFCCKTAVAVATGNRVFAAWRHVFPGSIRDIAMAMSTDGGSHFGPLARVSEDKWEIAGCPEDGPALAVDPSDNVLVVWPTVVNEGQPQKTVFYSSTKDGHTFTPRIRLSRSDQEAAHPQIAVGSSGVAAVVWDEPHGNGRQVILRTIGPDGEPGAGRAISSEGSASDPVVVAAGNDFLAGWTSGEGAAADIVLRRVSVGRPAARPGQNKAHAFRGKVESVDRGASTLTVQGEDVPGWMGAMTMMYGVDNKDVVAKLKPGDQITATVNDDDFRTLHGVALAPAR
jgi:Cu/Ag efflux protein CusF